MYKYKLDLESIRLLVFSTSSYTSKQYKDTAGRSKGKDLEKVKGQKDLRDLSSFTSVTTRAFISPSTRV